MLPLSNGPAQYLSDCNVSYKRAVLEEIIAQWRDSFHETRVHDAIREQNGADAIVLDPTIVVTQSRRPDLGQFFGERLAHGKLFARLRAAKHTRRARIVYSLGALALAPVLVWRALRRAWRRADMRLGALRALPLLVVAALAWSIGESLGALTPEAEAQPVQDRAATQK
jgi:hypothetical protein